MIRRFDELQGNVAQFARYCIEHLTVSELVSSAQNGIDYEACSRWDINSEEWQDAIFAALDASRENRL